MKLYPSVRRIIKRVTPVSGLLNFRAPVDVSLTQRVVADLGRAPQDLGLAAQQAPTDLRSRAAVGLAQSLEVGGTIVQPQPTGLTQRVAADLGRAPQPAGARIVQVQYDLTSTRPATSAAGYTVGGRQDWVNPGNAAVAPNGSSATIAGNALAARSGGLLLTMPPTRNKTDLTIQQVTVTFHVTHAGTVAANGDLRLSDTVGGARAPITGNVSTPQTYDITAAVAGSWAAISAFQATVEFRSGVAEVQTASCDAVVLTVVASLTDTL